MLKIRLSRTGKKHAPSFRIVVIPKERPRDGKAVEVLGHFNPSTNPPTLSVKRERLQYWLERGAQLTKPVEKLIKGKYEFKPYRPKEAKSQESEVSNKKETGEEKIEETGKPNDQDSSPKGGEEEQTKTEEIAND